MLHTEKAIYKHKTSKNLSHNMKQERNPIQKEKSKQEKQPRKLSLISLNGHKLSSQHRIIES